MAGRRQSDITRVEDSLLVAEQVDLRFTQVQLFPDQRAVEVAEQRIRPAAIAQSQRCALTRFQLLAQSDVQQTVCLTGRQRGAIG